MLKFLNHSWCLLIDVFVIVDDYDVEESLTGHNVCRPGNEQYGKTPLILEAKTSKENFPELLVLKMGTIRYDLRNILWDYLEIFPKWRTPHPPYGKK